MPCEQGRFLSQFEAHIDKARCQDNVHINSHRRADGLDQSERSSGVATSSAVGSDVSVLDMEPDDDEDLYIARIEEELRRLREKVSREAASSIISGSSLNAQRDKSKNHSVPTPSLGTAPAVPRIHCAQDGKQPYSSHQSFHLPLTGLYAYSRGVSDSAYQSRSVPHCRSRRAGRRIQTHRAAMRPHGATH